MKRNSWLMIVVTIIATLALGLAAGASDSMPASKATAQTLGYTVLEKSETTDWTPILNASIKTANQKDLFIDVSLQSGLYTKTTVSSKEMEKDSSKAHAGIKVRVWVDGVLALPGEVVFNDRSQTLSATLQGQINTVDTDGDGVLEPGELEVVAPEEIELILDTTTANAFNFVMPDVTSGVHNIVVEARIDIVTSVQSGVAEATALIGKGAVTVEEVRLIKDLQVELE